MKSLVLAGFRTVGVKMQQTDQLGLILDMRVMAREWF